ncbi:hypothetical protein J6590_093131 [Homalodisca vitripennis]|nr:hypothetical protein J6590_093131 [Homalodisca vitripennis]
MPLPVLPDTSATDKLTRRFSSFADCEWNCCAYIVKLVFDILGRCVVCTRNGLRKETIYVCETCTARPNLHLDTCFKTYHTVWVWCVPNCRSVGRVKTGKAPGPDMIPPDLFMIIAQRYPKEALHIVGKLLD